jgi:hypothetical protein
MALSATFLGATGDDFFEYWVTTVSGGVGENGRSVAIDSTGSIYVGGSTSSLDAGGSGWLLIKYSSAGTIQWQRTLGGADYESLENIAIDASDNVYICGWASTSSTSQYASLLVKYDSAGNLQWQKFLDGDFADYANDLAIDSLGNIYTAGSVSGSKVSLSKYNSSGVVQWQKSLDGGNTDNAISIKIDSADMIYLHGETRSGGTGGQSLLFVKYNSAGVLQWQNALGSTGYDYGAAIALDSADNVYATSRNDFFSASTILLAKINSAGALQWQRNLDGPNSYVYDEGVEIAIDSNNNVYQLAKTQSEGPGSASILLAKHNSSGAIQWQRTLGTSSSDQPYSIAVDSNDNLILCGYILTSNGKAQLLLAKLPSDGSLTGTYLINGVNIVYAESFLNESAGSNTLSALSLVSSDGTLVSSDAALTASSASIKQYFKGVG